MNDTKATDIQHHLDRDNDFTYIYRLYPYYGTLRYAFSFPVSYRENGEWEMHSWNSVYHLWKGKLWGPPPNGSVVVFWITGKLKEIEPRFRILTGTFEHERLPGYARIFSAFDFIPLRCIEKEYNGILLKAQVVEFRIKP